MALQIIEMKTMGFPIRCHVCGLLHEQPDAEDKVEYCEALVELEAYGQLHLMRSYNISKREYVVLSGFPELSEVG